LKKIIGILALISLTAFIVYSYLLIKATEVPQQRKLIEINSIKSNISIMIPKGNHFQLLLDIPFEKNFKGNCIIKLKDKIIKEFSFDSKTAQSCNWLQKKTSGLTYILSWHANTENGYFKDTFKEDQEYDFVIIFNEKPPNNSTLWLSWLY